MSVQFEAACRGVPALAIRLCGDVHDPLGLVAPLLQRLRLLRALQGPDRQR